MAGGLLAKTFSDAVGVQSVVRVHGWMLFRSSKLGDWLGYRLNVDVCDFDSLIVVDFEGFIYDAGWTFDCDALVRAFALL